MPQNSDDAPVVKGARKPLRFHQHHDERTANAWRVAGLTLEERGALMSIIHTTNQHGPRPVDPERFWVTQLGLIDPRPWRRVLDALRRKQMIRVQNGLILPLQCLGFSANVWGTSAQHWRNVEPTAAENVNDSNEPDPMNSELCPLKSAYHDSGDPSGAHRREHTCERTHTSAHTYTREAPDAGRWDNRWHERAASEPQSHPIPFFDDDPDDATRH